VGRETAGWVMNDRMFFATCDPLSCQCSGGMQSCITQPPAFNDQACIEQTDGHRPYIKGNCCSTCAAGLVQTLAGSEAQEWAVEADLKADDMDGSDLQKRPAGELRPFNPARNGGLNFRFRGNMGSTPVTPGSAVLLLGLGALT
jgi:hypothetical protein